MTDQQKILQKRLTEIWKPSQFANFFERYATRPPIKIKKGSILFNEGEQIEKIIFIKEGFVKLYHVSEQGRDTTIYLYGPGYILGIRALTSEDQATKHAAEAITDAVILTISRKAYLQILSESPEYILDLTHIFIDRLNYTERKLEGFIISDTPSRTASFLLDCAKRFGKEQERVILLPLPLTHQLIADCIGAYRETVSIALKKLEEEKIIHNERGTITILDREKLESSSAF